MATKAGTASHFSLPWALRCITAAVGTVFVLRGALQPANPCNGDLCYTGSMQEVLLLASRFTAGTCYCSLTVIVLAKLPNTRCAIQASFLNTLIDFEPTHSLHVEHGYLFSLASIVHSGAHVVRVSLRQENATSWATTAFRTGATMLVLLALVVVPMAVPFLRRKIAYGVRKGLHFAFVPLLVVFGFHARGCTIAAVVLLGWYALDSACWLLFRTYLVEHPHFSPAGGGTSVRFALPHGYTFRPGQYIYVNVPWIGCNEWHPFSIIPSPAPVSSTALHKRPPGDALAQATVQTQASGGRLGNIPTYASFYAAAVGDWTKELYTRSVSAVGRPIWISRPMPGPAEHSMNFDRIVLVGSGAGVTPLLSLIERYRGLKHMDLLWATRDAHMVKHFCAQVARGVSSARIFYTGGRRNDFDWLLGALGGAGPLGVAGPRQQDVSDRVCAFTPVRNRGSVSHMRDADEIMQPEHAPSHSNLRAAQALQKSWGRVRAESCVSVREVLPSEGEEKESTVCQTHFTTTRWFPVREMLGDDGVESGGSGEPRHSVRIYAARPQLGHEVRRALLSGSGSTSIREWCVVYCGVSVTAVREIFSVCRELGVCFRHETNAQW